MIITIIMIMMEIVNDDNKNDNKKRLKLSAENADV